MLHIARRFRQHQRPRCPAPPTGQKGAALLIFLIIIVLGTTGLLLNSLNRATITTERDRITADALAQAKEALIAYAVSVLLPTTTDDGSNTTARPGDLPCPAADSGGVAATSCGNIAGTTGQTSRLGRLPWKTLGLPDLRDGHGEQLWYAVSINFKRNYRTPCTSAPVDRSGCLNSDTRGTITVRNSSGAVINDGSNPDVFTPSGVIAVVIAPGAVLQRQGAVVTQDRSAAGAANPQNYLDTGNGEDNADFIDGNATNGFINGPILALDASGNPIAIVNDRLITITYQGLMPKLEKRVAGEVLKCLTDYAAGNSGRYPWAADIGASGSSSDYSDVSGKLFGRIPDTPFTRTNTSSGGGMSGNSAVSCNIFSTSDWWLNWKEQVFYGLADAYKPVNPPATTTACGTCLAVNPPSATANKQVVVIVAGKRLSGVASGQPRTTGDKGNVNNYLEGQNQTYADDIFAPGSPTSATLNDTLVYQ